MKYLIALLCVLFLFSCKHKQQPNEITKIELVRTGAWSDRGAAISIDSSLAYKYYDRNLKHGYYIGKVAEKFWDTLNAKFQRINYKKLTAKNLNTYDENYFVLIVYGKNGQLQVKRGRLPTVI